MYRLCISYVSLLGLAVAQHYTDGGEMEYDDYDYVMDKIYYQPGSEDYTVGEDHSHSGRHPRLPAGTEIQIPTQNSNHHQHAGHQHAHRNRGTQERYHGEKQGFRNEQFHFENKNPNQQKFQTPGHPHPHHNGAQHNPGKRQAPHRLNNNNVVLNLDKGFFDENFPGVIESNNENFFGHPDHSFQDNFKLNENIGNLNEPLHNINHQQFQNNQIRLKRNKNRFRGNNQNQFQHQHSEVYGHIGELDSQSYQDQENQPLFIRNTRLHHLQGDVLDKGPLLNDLLYRQTGPLQQKHPQYGNGNKHQPGHGYNFGYHGDQGNLPRNKNRNKTRFKKNTGFLGLGNIVSVRWS